MAQHIQIRRGLAAVWTADNPLLAEGELGVELDTNKWKIGDGVLNWNARPYAPQGIQGVPGPARASGTTGAPESLDRPDPRATRATRATRAMLGPPDLRAASDHLAPKEPRATRAIPEPPDSPDLRGAPDRLAQRVPQVWGDRGLVGHDRAEHPQRSGAVDQPDNAGHDATDRPALGEHLARIRHVGGVHASGRYGGRRADDRHRPALQPVRRGVDDPAERLGAGAGINVPPEHGTGCRRLHRDSDVRQNIRGQWPRHSLRLDDFGPGPDDDGLRDRPDRQGPDVGDDGRPGGQPGCAGPESFGAERDGARLLLQRHGLQLRYPVRVDAGHQHDRIWPVQSRVCDGWADGDDAVLDGVTVRSDGDDGRSFTACAGRGLPEDVGRGRVGQRERQRRSDSIEHESSSRRHRRAGHQHELRPGRSRPSDRHDARAEDRGGPDRRYGGVNPGRR